ncbi:ABC transporter substrate-binding protein ['Osedax' symbiont bacterium Rs2_46_30_T18]|nr:ABC transporter substrate-binding protein ['Osedax' symbiont bacterium Rs2_46_30_T18]
MKLKKIALTSAAFALASVMHTTALAETTIKALFMSQAAYSETDVKSMTAEFEKSNPDVKVNLEFVPYDALHSKIVAASGAGSQGYDVVLFDVIWPAEFAKRGFLLDVSDRIPSDYSEQIFQGAWTTVEYAGKRYGMPWILDTKYLFYNKEMLSKAGIATPPKTWDEMLQQSKIIKDKGIVKYPMVWNWSQSEGMICDYTTIMSSMGGDFFIDGKPAFNTGGAVQALNYMRGSLDDGLSNPSSREFSEEDVRRVFSNGEAAFALNWTYMNALANDPKESKIAGKVGIAPAPGTAGISTASAVNGSMGLGIPSGSAHPDEAWAFISHLTKQGTQEQFSKLSLPIWKKSYTVPAVTNGQQDLVAAAKESIAVMYPRPLVKSYAEISDILQLRIHEVLLGKNDAQSALDAASKKVARIR